VEGGTAVEEGGIVYLDAAVLAASLADGKAFADLGAAQLGGPIRVRAADPYQSASGLQFAAVLANALAGDVITADSLRPNRAKLVRIFSRMGRKPPNAKQLFEEYLAAGPAGAPLAVGYESQHLEWAIGQAQPPAAGARPVMIYPRPSVMAAHAFISLTEAGDRLLAALQAPEAQAIAWSRHGLRNSAGAAGAATNPAIAGRFPAASPAVLPLPDAELLLGLAGELSGRLPPPQAAPAYSNEPFSPYRR
jgi:hypothetical protein